MDWETTMNKGLLLVAAFVGFNWYRNKKIEEAAKAGAQKVFDFIGGGSAPAPGDEPIDD